VTTHMTGAVRPDAKPGGSAIHVDRIPILTLGLTTLCLLGACAWSMAVALANQPYFDLLNGFVGARDAVPRGLLFSSWLVLVGGVVLIWRPPAFGLRIGQVREHVPLIVGMTVVAALATAVILKLTGSTPYSDASLFIESVVVPFTEELVFRAVLLTVLLAALMRLHDASRATALAIVINGVAFGMAHLANATSIATSFVIAQAVFAAVLGGACAYLMVRTRSVYPPMVLHGVVNAVVVVV
jgi:membrane protease YdiL (CAAX protease family)